MRRAFIFLLILSICLEFACSFFHFRSRFSFTSNCSFTFEQALVDSSDSPISDFPLCDTCGHSLILLKLLCALTINQIPHHHPESTFNFLEFPTISSPNKKHVYHFWFKQFISIPSVANNPKQQHNQKYIHKEIYPYFNKFVQHCMLCRYVGQFV